MVSSTSTSPFVSATPAIPPPSGTTSNFLDPSSLASYSNITIAVCVPFTTILFLLRSYVRIQYKRTWVSEDWLVLMSWIGTVTFCALMAMTMANHGGIHAWNITAAELGDVIWWFNVTATEYACAMCITKISILWLYRRTFSHCRGSRFEKIVYVFIAVLICFYGSTAVAKIVECVSAGNTRYAGVLDARFNYWAEFIANGIFNTITDFAILLMPSMIIYRLQVTPRKRVLILMIFTFGLCAPVFSVVGLYLRIVLGNNPDISWNRPEILLWSVAENTTGTMCVCIPEVGLLFKRKNRPGSGPSKSVLQGARSTIARLRRPKGRDQFSSQLRAIDDLEIGGPDVYIELNEEREHKTEISATPSRDTVKRPERSIYIRHDIHVESE